MLKRWGIDGRRTRICLFLFFIFSLRFIPTIHAGQTCENLLQALGVAGEWDQRFYERFPITYTHLLSGGYFVVHSARMSEAGAIGIGGSYAPPYLNWNIRAQPLSQLEIGVNYRVFREWLDPSIGKFGFGEYADRGANCKIALFTPEQSLYAFPGLAFGIDDFMGSKKFTTYYVVATQVMREWGLEVSGGWQASTHKQGPSKGFFGGFAWFPFWRLSTIWLKGFALSAEYDPTDYRYDPHPWGRTSHSPTNWGAKYLLEQTLEFSVGYLRGEKIAVSGSVHYNWGKTPGFLPKFKDPPLFTPSSSCGESLMRKIKSACATQGFLLLRSWRADHTLWLVLTNCCYRQEQVVRRRLQYILGTLLPDEIEKTIVILEQEGLLCQQYTYDTSLLRRYISQVIGGYEFDILAPREEVQRLPKEAVLLAQHRCEWWRGWGVGPRFETFLGNIKGKFKYYLGIKCMTEGLLPGNLLYHFQVSYTALSTLRGLADFDYFYPSQLPNVATDYVRYRQQSAYTWDVCYLQKSWNLGRGCFMRWAGGYFQVNYAGIEGEFLWYPVQSPIALGAEYAALKKRRYAGWDFQSTLRQFDGPEPVYIPYFLLSQYFLNIYIDFPLFSIFTKFSGGQFLAGDLGGRFEVTRYFSNGVRFTGWLTMTNAGDVMHGERYFDRGVCLELPLDFFYRRSSRRVWNYALAAWLRDAGYASTTGRPLFEILNRERRW